MGKSHQKPEMRAEDPMQKVRRPPSQTSIAQLLEKPVFGSGKSRVGGGEPSRLVQASHAKGPCVCGFVWAGKVRQTADTLTLSLHLSEHSDLDTEAKAQTRSSKYFRLSGFVQDVAVWTSMIQLVDPASMHRVKIAILWEHERPPTIQPH